MATRQQVMKRCKELGVEFSEDDYAIYADAPDGYQFKVSGYGCCDVPYSNNGGQSWKPQAYQEMIDDMAEGLEPCDDPAMQSHLRGNCDPATCPLCGKAVTV